MNTASIYMKMDEKRKIQILLYRAHLTKNNFKTRSSVPSGQKMELWAVWCVTVLDKISTAMWAID